MPNSPHGRPIVYFCRLGLTDVSHSALTQHHFMLVSKGRQLWLTRAFPAGPGALPQPHGAASSRPSFLSAPHDAPGSSHAPLSPVLAQPVLQAALPPLTGGCYRRGVWVRGTYRTSRSSHLLGLTLRPSVEVMPNVHTDWKLGDVRGDKYAQRHSPFAVSFRF